MAYLEKSIETFMHQQEAVHAQLSRMMTTGPLGTMTELTRQNLELWARMQESMLAAFAPPSPPKGKANGKAEDV